MEDRRETVSPIDSNLDLNSEVEEDNQNEIDGEKNNVEIDVCPICFQLWTSGGDHQICCLPCGHLYGMSCIKKWLQRNQRSGKYYQCPQCKSLCTLKDVRVIYATRLCVAEEDLHKFLEARCSYLEEMIRYSPRYSSDEIREQFTQITKLQQETLKTIHDGKKQHELIDALTFLQTPIPDGLSEKDKQRLKRAREKLWLKFGDVFGEDDKEDE